MKKVVSASVSALMLGGLFAIATTGAFAAEQTLTLQDFENKDAAMGPWGGLQTEFVDDDSQDGMKAMHIFWEVDAEEWCGSSIPIEAFGDEWDTLRLRFKGTNSKKVVSLYLFDNGGERYSYALVDKYADWATVEIPLKRFGVDGWQPDDSDKNKKKDYPFKSMMIQRAAKVSHDFYLDLIEVVKK